MTGYIPLTLSRCVADPFLLTYSDCRANVLLLCPLQETFVADFIRPSDAEDVSEVRVHKDLQFVL